MESDRIRCQDINKKLKMRDSKISENGCLSLWERLYSLQHSLDWGEGERKTLFILDINFNALWFVAALQRREHPFDGSGHKISHEGSHGDRVPIHLNRNWIFLS